MTKYEKLKRCVGCEDNFYNGNNTLGVSECWGLETMKMKRRKAVHVDQVPPWNQKAEWYPSCYKRRRYVFVNPGVTR